MIRETTVTKKERYADYDKEIEMERFVCRRKWTVEVKPEADEYIETPNYIYF